MPRPRYRRNISKRPRSFTQETTVFHPRDHGLSPKRPRSFTQETTVFHPRDHGLSLKRPRSFLLLMPVPGTGSGLRACFGQGGSVSPTATDDRRHPWKSLARARNRRSPDRTSLCRRRRETGVRRLELMQVLPPPFRTQKRIFPFGSWVTCLRECPVARRISSSTLPFRANCSLRYSSRLSAQYSRAVRLDILCLLLVSHRYTVLDKRAHPPICPFENPVHVIMANRGVRFS